MALFFFPLTSRRLILGQHILKREKERSRAGVSNSVFSLAGGAGACSALWVDSVSALAVVGEKGIFVERISGWCIVGVFLSMFLEPYYLTVTKLKSRGEN